MKKIFGGYWVIAIAAVVGALVFAQPARAEYTVKQFRELKENPAFQFYILGVGTGFKWANAHLKNEKRPQLFCEPDKLALNGENFMDLLTGYIEHYKPVIKDDWTVELMLLRALEEAFPCKGETPDGKEKR